MVACLSALSIEFCRQEYWSSLPFPSPGDLLDSLIKHRAPALYIHSLQSSQQEIPKKGNAKNCSNYCKIALISYASKVVLKILQIILQQYVNHEPSDVQVLFRKGSLEKPEIWVWMWLKAPPGQSTHVCGPLVCNLCNLCLSWKYTRHCGSFTVEKSSFGNINIQIFLSVNIAKLNLLPIIGGALRESYTLKVVSWIWVWNEEIKPELISNFTMNWVPEYFF